MNEQASRRKTTRTLTWIAVPVIAVAVALSGCVAPRGWVYSVTPPAERPAVSTHTVVVPPLLDERPVQNDNKVWLYWIPLFPFGWQDLNVPERHPNHINSNQWQFNPPEDLARVYRVSEVFFSASLMLEPAEPQSMRVFWTRRCAGGVRSESEIV